MYFSRTCSERMQEVVGEIEWEKGKNRVNRNCSKIIESMSEHLCVLASNKYAAWESEPIWANKGSAHKKSNQGEGKSKCKQSCSVEEHRTKNEAERLEMMQNYAS